MFSRQMTFLSIAIPLTFGLWIGSCLLSADTYVWVRKPGLRSVRFVDGRHGWIAGTEGVFYTSNAGESWNKLAAAVAKKFGFPTTQLLDNSGKILWADEREALVRSDEGLLVCNGHSGKSSLIKSAQLSRFLDMAFVDPSVGWGITETDIYSTRDSGRTWQSRGERSSEGYSSMSLVSKEAVWVLGHQTFLAHTRDGGETWSKFFFRRGSLYPLLFVKFVDPKRGWIFTADGAWFSNDGGSTWSQHQSKELNTTLLFAISFSDRDRGWMVGDGTIFQTDNGGRDWTVKIRNIKDWLVDVSTLPSGDAWAVGREGTVMKSTDKGNRWTYWNLEWDFNKLQSVPRRR